MTDQTPPLHHRFLAIDEGRQSIALIDTDRPDSGWSFPLGERPLARALQRIGPDRALVGYDRGYFELELSTGRIVRDLPRWTKVTSAWRQADGSTLVAGIDLDGQSGVTVLTLDPQDSVCHRARRDGDYVRLLQPTASGSYLLCTNDHILETTPELATIRELRAEGFLHAWKALRLDDGSTLVAGGYGAFMARFDASGQLSATFGRAGQVPDWVEPNFYASFQVLDDGRIVAANWQGHGPDNGAKGRQLVEFNPDGSFRGAWSDPEKISSLQGLLIL